MQEVRLESGLTTVLVNVPESLVTFIRKWADEGGYSVDEVVLSLLSRALTQVQVTQNLGATLNEMLQQASDDIIRLAPDDSVVIEVRIGDGGVCPKCGQRH